MRPTKYKKEFAEQAEKLCKLGAIDTEMADFFGVAESTIYKWKLDHPMFSEAIKKGKMLADAEVASSLYNKAVGYSCVDTKFATHEGIITDEREYIRNYPPDSVAGMFWLKNRKANVWRDKQEVEHSGEMQVTSIERKIV